MNQITGTEKIRLGDSHRARHCAVARNLNRQFRTGAPAVPKPNDHGELVLYADRIDFDFLKDLQLAESACRFFHSGRIVCLTGSEQQAGADDVLVGGDPKAVHAPSEKTRLRLFIWKHVVDDDDDCVDHRRDPVLFLADDVLTPAEGKGETSCQWPVAGRQSPAFTVHWLPATIDCPLSRQFTVH